MESGSCITGIIFLNLLFVIHYFNLYIFFQFFFFQISPMPVHVPCRAVPHTMCARARFGEHKLLHIVVVVVAVERTIILL